MCCQRQQILRLQNTEIRKLCVMSQSMVSTRSLCLSGSGQGVFNLARTALYLERAAHQHTLQGNYINSLEM